MLRYGTGILGALIGCVVAAPPAMHATASDPFVTADGAAAVFRWTGSAGDRRWTTPGNWQARTSDGQWLGTERVPPRKSVIVFDNAAPDAPQYIDISYHVEVARIVVDACGDHRRFIVRSWLDPDDIGIDSDSGMVYGLRLTDSRPILQTPRASDDLMFRVAVTFTSPEPPAVHALSRHAAGIALDAGFSVLDNELRIERPEAESGGQVTRRGDVIE